MSNNIKYLNLLISQNEFKQAKDYINNLKITGLEKPFVLDYYHGLIRLKNKNYSEAIFFFKQVLLVKKDFFEALINLGVAYLSDKQIEESKKTLRLAIDLNPSFSDSYIFLSKSYFHEKLYDDGIKIIENALKQFPNNTKLLFELSKIYIERKEYKLGISIISKYLKLNPNDCSAFNNLGICQEAEHQYEHSIFSFKKSLQINPSFIPALLNLGNALRGIANFSEAEINFKKVIEIDKYNFEAHKYLSTIHHYNTDQDEHLKLMEKIINHEEFKSKKNTERSLVYFALFKAYEDLENYEKSSHFLLLANKTHRQGINYSEKIIKEHFVMMKNIFTAEFVKQQQIYGSDSHKPIFIIGMPRSGTTLVEQIISSHSKVDSGGELFFLQKYIKKYFPESEPNIFIKKVKEDGKVKFSNIANNYLQEINYLSNNYHLTDKLPFNFFFFGFIRIVFPNARIIICKRSAKDICLSIYKNYFPMEQNFAYDQIELANYYNLYLDLISFWKQKFYGSYYEIEYENLISNQIDESKKLINACGLDWEENCLHFHKNKTSVNTLSTAQVRQSLYNSSLAGWKRYEQSLSTMFNLLPD
jgi:tetratricopeptide (TPR) repeat protein